MPVLIDTGPPGLRLFAATERDRNRALPEYREDDPNYVEIGLLNNMPDLALEQTERQIFKLLDAAADGLLVCVRLYALTDLPRGDLGQKHLNRLRYRHHHDLLNRRIDGLIITGAEPKAADLTLEPYWHSLTNILDWADSNTISTVSSCLAVHAAVFHFDGVERHALKQKCFGVFDFKKVMHDPLLVGHTGDIRMPHSRWNEIREKDLISRDYKILIRSEHHGVDTFIKLKRSLFIFFQGHPEYEAWTLLGEYRRDIGRFLAGEQENHPEMPHGYFDEGCEEILRNFRLRALKERRKELMADFPSDRLTGRLTDTWRTAACRTYANWLRYISVHKTERARSSHSNASRPAVHNAEY